MTSCTESSVAIYRNVLTSRRNASAISDENGDEV